MVGRDGTFRAQFTDGHAFRQIDMIRPHGKLREMVATGLAHDGSAKYAE
jgi:hypothetical protein